MAPRRRFDALLFTCEHGGNQIPARYKSHFRGEDKLLETHRGYDIGALSVAKALAKEMGAPLFFSTTSRLVVDLNRSLGHKTAFSEFTESLAKSEKDHITARFYEPYRRSVTEWIQNQIAAKKRVLHLSIHSFTPVLRGVVRNAEVGILYDPKRPLELAFACDLHDQLVAMQDLYRVRRNYPYLGYADGFQTSLRKMFSERVYAGLEIEMNQGITKERSGQKSMSELFLKAFTAQAL
jgi:predicted N-formylglutamate amidohydrolase